ncbi:MAG TPA: hypothetical protein VKB50_04105 [Vicinamibacterales bacterium]|nr:hypothetical protein [Vicinamibacterales bacterium]
MNPIAAGVAGALIAGVAMYTVGAKAGQVDPFTQTPVPVQTVGGQFVPATYTTALRPIAAPPIGTVTPVSNARRTSAPPRRTANRTVTTDREIVRDEEIREETKPERSWGKTAMIIGGSAASGAGVGGIVGGKKGAMLGAAIGGGAASIYEATRRR